MITLQKMHIEQALDLLDGTLKMSDEDLQWFVYDMRIALLKDQIDGEEFAQETIEGLKKDIERLEDENDELRDKIYDMELDR